MLNKTKRWKRSFSTWKETLGMLACTSLLVGGIAVFGCGDENGSLETDATVLTRVEDEVRVDKICDCTCEHDAAPHYDLCPTNFKWSIVYLKKVCPDTDWEFGISQKESCSDYNGVACSGYKKDGSKHTDAKYKWCSLESGSGSGSGSGS